MKNRILSLLLVLAFLLGVGAVPVSAAAECSGDYIARQINAPIAIAAYGGVLDPFPTLSGTSTYFHGNIGDIEVYFYIRENGQATNRVVFVPSDRYKEQAEIVSSQISEQNGAYFVSAGYFAQLMCSMGYGQPQVSDYATAQKNAELMLMVTFAAAYNTVIGYIERQINAPNFAYEFYSTYGFYPNEATMLAYLVGAWNDIAPYYKAGIDYYNDTFNDPNALLLYMAQQNGGSGGVKSSLINSINAGITIDEFLNKYVESSFRTSVKSAFSSDATVTKLTKDTIAYRYYGGESARSSRWFSPKLVSDPKTQLALPRGNTAEFIDTVILPKGTIILEGTVAPKFGMPGGGYQIYVP